MGISGQFKSKIRGFEPFTNPQVVVTLLIIKS